MRAAVIMSALSFSVNASADKPPPNLLIPLLFDTQRKIWSSVCPDEVESSAYNKGVEKKRQTDILEKTNLTDKVFEEPDWIAGIAGRR